MWSRSASQCARSVEPVLLQCWLTVCDAGPTLYKHWLYVSRLLGSLKGLAQAKIIKKSVILFRVLNMTIWCKHVHRLELQIFIIFVLRIHQLG